MHALQVRDGPLACHGFAFGEVDGQVWSMIEALWVQDQEPQAWLTLKRVLAVTPYAGDVIKERNRVFGEALGAYSEVVEAARLIAGGTWIDAAHVVPVARDAGGNNTRLTNAHRPRLWAAVFGAPRAMPGRRRQWEQRVEWRPPQDRLPHGPAYVLDANRARAIESCIADLAQFRRLAPDHGWWFAHDAYQRGHDLFLPRRQRLVLLFCALEAVYGPFRGERGDPGLGATVARVLDQAGGLTNNPGQYVEGVLRQARNVLAHGSDGKATVNFAEVEVNLLDIMRIGLGFSADWIRGLRQPDSALPPGSARTLAGFQRWMGRVVSD